MTRGTKILLVAAVLATTLISAFANGQLGLVGEAGALTKQKTGYTDEFFLGDCDFSSKGSNRFFILEPDYQLRLRGEGKDGTKIQLTITVLDRTKEVDGVQTRIVEEKETEDGEVVEVSKNYFAICKQTNSVFYFGESVDIYEGGKVVSHEGSWLAGEDQAKAGLIMAGVVLLGAKYQQETAPGVAMDRAEIVSMDEEVETPAGNFKGVLNVRETTPLGPGLVDYKYYAAGIGLIQDGNLKLEQHGFV